MAASSSFQYHIQILLLCLFLLSTTMCNSKVIRCDEKDKSTLLKFKHGVTDPSGLLSSWSNEKKDCCQWKGVHCDNTTGKVTELNLPCTHIYPAYYLDKSHCLTGELDMSSLFDLQFLTHLNLSNNDFNTIQYHGQHGNSSNNIHHLDLSNNNNLKADNILHWISNLSSLQFLDLEGINLQMETNWLQSVTLLPSLLVLGLEGCGLRDIYPTLQYANFTALKVLDLSDNDFVPAKLPSWVFNLSSGISIIDLSNNFMQGQLPETLPYFQGLESLYLSSNYLNGSIPNWVGQLQKLQILVLAENSFSGPLPTSLGNLSSLALLSLESNPLTGNVSERHFHSFSKLTDLSLGSQSLVFDFDPQWIPPFQLQYLILDFASPKLPLWVYTQKSLTLLNIENSSIPLEQFDKFWKFVSNHVEYLELLNNLINGDMSNVLLNSKVVVLSDNKLSGGVPRVSPNVTLLDLSYNSLSGPISPFLCPKTKEKNNLKYLDISQNLLSREIPDCWMHWKSLLYINLEDNNLTGQIPYSIGSLSNLISLSLYNNMLFGEVPLSLKNCKILRLLNLGENEFSGVISSWVGQSVIGLQLRSNQFSGNISTICQLHSLKILDLSNNRLSGSIPNCCRNMKGMISNNESFDSFHVTIPMISVTFWSDINVMLLIKGIKLNYTHSMRAIDLSSNNLSGSVPSELFMLIGLQSLNLSHNQFIGLIPQDIGNLSQLESLDLSNNLFSGQIPQSMSGLSFLGDLNLSCNNFEGKIPFGTQLQGFSNLSYMENPKLCGPPLTKICPQDEKPPNEKQMREDDDDDDSFEVYSWFYMGLGIGFATSFLTVLIAIFFNRKFRYAYFRCLNQFCEVVKKFNPIS